MTKKKNEKKSGVEAADITPASAASLRKLPVVEVAEALEELPPDQLLDMLPRFSPEQQGVIVSDFGVDTQKELFQLMDRRSFARLFEQMYSDVRADLFQQMTPSEQAALLPFISKRVREDVIQLSAYPPETAGGIMNTDYATLEENMTVAAALARLRQDAPSKKMIYYLYVVDEQRRLRGFVTLKNLVFADPDMLVRDLVNREFVYASIDEDREEVARKIEKYDLVAIPVINEAGQLTGIVSHDDALDIIRSEQTEDMEKFMGIVPAKEELEYMDTSVLGHFRKRAAWIVSLAALGIISGMIVHRFESTLERLLILALYMPMMADTGGNTGSQAATVVVRALALGQIHAADWLLVVWKEVRVSILLAVCLGLLAYGKVLFLSWETEIPSSFTLAQVGFVISLALALQVVTATVIGALMPIVVKRLGGDPAVAASPAITTTVDITGLLIYFGMAVWLLNV